MRLFTLRGGVVFGAAAIVLSACASAAPAATLPRAHGAGHGAGGGDDASSAAGSGGMAGNDDALTDQASAFCALTYGQFAVAFDGCCSSASDRGRDEYTATIAFLQSLTTACSSLLAAAAITQRVTLDASAMTACEGAFGTASTTLLPCAGVPVDPTAVVTTACAQAIVGAGADLDPCDHGFECAAGLTCVPSGPGALDPAARTCGAPPVAGAPCGFALALPFGDHPPCAPGLYCSGTTGLCAKPAASGERCDDDRGCAVGSCVLGACAASLVATGQPCAVSRDCAAGDFCDGAIAPTTEGAGGSGGDGGSAPIATPGTCAARKPAGAACTSSEACAGVCDPSTHQCVAFCGSL